MLSVQTWLRLTARAIVSLEQEFGICDDLTDDVHHISIIYASKGFGVDIVFFEQKGNPDVTIGMQVKAFKSVKDWESSVTMAKKILADVSNTYGVKTENPEVDMQ